MNSLSLVKVIAAAFTVNASADEVDHIKIACSWWGNEFMRGCETGFNINSKEFLDDYSCPIAEFSQNALSYIDLAKPVKKMFDNMKLSELSTVLDFNLLNDLAFDSVMTSAKI